MSIDFNEVKGWKDQSNVYKEKIMKEKGYTLADLLTGKISLEEIEQEMANENKTSYTDVGLIDLVNRKTDSVSREEIFDILENLEDDDCEECFFDDVETFLTESIEARVKKQKKLFKKVEKVEEEIEFLYKLLENYASEE